MFNATSKDNTEDIEFIWHAVFDPRPSPSIKPPTQEIEDEKHQIAHELLFMASQNGALSVAKLLLEDEEYGADISFLQAPQVTTSLYVVAAQNHLSVLEYFLENYRGKVDLHAASMRFANGATAF
jgi:hypothetical protein